jgi:hypothetical protein
MPANRKFDQEAKQLYEYLKSNPYASYDDMAAIFPDDLGININSLLVKLKRAGCIEMIKQQDAKGKIAPSYKRCIKEPGF